MGENAPQFWEWCPDVFENLWVLNKIKHGQFIYDQQININSLFLHAWSVTMRYPSLLASSWPHTRGWILQSSSQLPPYIGMVESGITQKKKSTPANPIKRYTYTPAVKVTGYYSQFPCKMPSPSWIVYCGVLFHDVLSSDRQTIGADNLEVGIFMCNFQISH